MRTIKIDENTYELESTFGGKKTVNDFLKENGKKITVDECLKEILGYVKQAIDINKIEDESERKKSSMELVTSIKDEFVLYCLWSLMINKANYRELTYEKFFEIIFDINKSYKTHELVNIIIEAFSDSMIKNDTENKENVEDQKKKE
jgi:hypothetical protein